MINKHNRRGKTKLRRVFSEMDGNKLVYGKIIKKY